MVAFFAVNWHGAVEATAIIVASDREDAFAQLRNWIKEDCCPSNPESEWYLEEIVMRRGTRVNVIMR